MRAIKLLITALFIQVVNLSFAQTDWKLFQEEEGLRIEVKDVECNTENVSNQRLVLLRFTNTTSEKRQFTWKVEVWRNDICMNCHKINSGEYTREVVLEPGESIEGTCDSKDNKALYIFGHFIELVPGMTEQHLTAFHFIDLSSTAIQ